MKNSISLMMGALNFKLSRFNQTTIRSREDKSLTKTTISLADLISPTILDSNLLAFIFKCFQFEY